MVVDDHFEDILWNHFYRSEFACRSAAGVPFCGICTHSSEPRLSRGGCADAESFPVEAWRRLALCESLSMCTAATFEMDVQGPRSLRAGKTPIAFFTIIEAVMRSRK